MRKEEIQRFKDALPEFKPVHQEARISQLTHRVVVDQVMLATITSEMRVSSIYEAAKLLLAGLKEEVKYEHPIMMQFDAVEKSTGYTFCIMTNVRLRETPAEPPEKYL